jgi:glycosyltransferase involved in cell wall biosynthesis
MNDDRVRVLYVISRRNTFTKIDRDILAERFELTEYYQPGPLPRPRELVAKVRRCDVMFAWFASWHALAALTVASRLGKPSVLVIGGFDTSDLPGYGWQRGGLRRRISRHTMGLATRLITNSRNSLREIETIVGLDPRRATVVYHGLEDRFGTDAPSASDGMVLTVGVVRRENLSRKGHLPFVRAAALLPETPFVLAGRWPDGAIDVLRREAGSNVTFTGYLDDPELDALFRRAAVYVQASEHEGFGLSLAEAMLARCVPVVTPAGALPEVVGDIGVTIPEPTTEHLAVGIRRALELGPDEGARARTRVLEQFPLRARAEALWREVEAAAAGVRSG